MVDGKECIFDNILEAKNYILKEELKELNSDFQRNKLRIWNNFNHIWDEYFNNQNSKMFIMTKLQSLRYSLKPNLKDRKYLFRGEREFHSPCSPNLFRSQGQTSFIREMIECQEIYLLMLSHPLVKLLDEGIEINGSHIKFEMNLFGLCQHYYKKTCFLDLTSNIDVAMFFASTYYDEINDAYTPIKDENHNYGVLYYYSLNVFKDFKCQPNLSTIGLQVFPRSGQQKGFLYRLEKGKDFNQLSQLKCVRFKHDSNCAQDIYEEFGGGKTLFPDDILSKHLKNNTIKNEISIRTIKLNQIMNSSNKDLSSEISNLGYKISDYLPSFTSDELDEYYLNAKDIWANFCNQIYIPMDNGSMMNALKNIPNEERYKWAFESGYLHNIDYDKGYLLRIYKDCLI